MLLHNSKWYGIVWFAVVWYGVKWYLCMYVQIIPGFNTYLEELANDKDIYKNITISLKEWRNKMSKLISNKIDSLRVKIILESFFSLQ